MKNDKKWLRGLDNLLDLDGEVFLLENGYWTKMEVCRAETDEHRPHGIKYSLTLHDRHNKRILGYDNAHAIKPRRGMYSGRVATWDHKHKSDRIVNYEFESPEQLLVDFWTEVDEILKEE